MNDNNRLKIAVISGASHALQYKKQNPHASDDEILRYVSNSLREILEKIGQED